jgi:fructose-1,6-bisphosphatase/inositol monophosphatase family enzyme
MAASDELLALALRAGDAAAALLLDSHERALATIDTKSTATDMVTEVDRASEALIRDALLGARPGDGFLGEESGERAGTSGIRWVVDPLDGTTNYLYGHPGWNVAIAAEDEHGAVVSVVVDPVLGDTFTATRGGGATRNGRRIACRAITDVAAALCATGFAYDPARRARQGAVLAAVLPRVRDIRRMGAAAVDLCSVACGRVDAYWERGLGPWDVAAGSLVAREAGATVTIDAASGLVLAAPSAIVDVLRAILVDAGAETA